MDSATPHPDDAVTPAVALARFADLVAADAPLRTRLATIREHEVFAAACVAAAREHGLVFSAEDLRSLLQSRHLLWLQRHLW